MLRNIIAFLLMLSHAISQASERDFERVRTLINHGNAELAVEMALRFAEAGTEDFVVYEYLGYVYKDGILNGKSDAETAIDYYLKAVDLGSVDAYFELGQIYSLGRIVEKNCKLSVSYYERAVELGDLDSMAMLAEDYAVGDCVSQDYRTAMALLEKPLKAGNSLAQSGMAAMYFFGRGVEVDVAQAIAYWQKAAAQENCFAMSQLGASYDNGIGVDIDLEKAFNYFEQSAQFGCYEGTANLAHMYNLGRYVKQDTQKAFELYSQASALGSLEAQAEQSVLLIHGDGTEQNIEMGKQLLLEAAEKGDNTAITHLADQYMKGQYFDKDYKKAFDWYSEAAATDGFAQAGLAWLYEHGLGVEQDLYQAASLYQQSLHHGNVYGVVALARWYMHGIYYNRDHQQALQLLDKWQHTSDDSVVAWLARLKACSSDSDIRNEQAAIDLLYAHISTKQEYYYEVDIALAEALLSLGDMEKAQQALDEIADLFQQPEKQAERDLNDFASERYQTVSQQIANRERCSF